MTDKYQTRAIVLEKPESVILADLELTPMTPIDVLVDMEWSGISTGTEKLLWTGKMPNFPGMGDRKSVV
jgi:3-hydroxyethyl bacteriochlorophyllide a dehydrogenase